MSGKAKLQLLIELKQNLNKDLNRARNTVNKATGDMQNRLDSFKNRALTNFVQIRNEVPLVGQAFSTMKNPIVGATAAVGALAFATKRATVVAQEFSGEYRQLQMLNLDKPIREMNKYKALIRSTAFEKGFDPIRASTAYFDVQSTTGKYGGAVDRIVAKQGEFARLMQADFNNYISGTAKAMANFGFGYNQLDEFNRAAFATVQTGVTSFDQLAKVQSVYAGAASAAKQNFASANKMFSIFTTKVNSVDEAATLTKSLFNDLTKASTIRAFDDIGIDVYNVNKKFKQADTLLLELQNKFRELGETHSSLITLKNQFSGSEGLINFVQAATNETNTLQNVINTFDSTKFTLPKAIEIAKKDINYINEQLENKTKVLMSDLGDSWLPYKKLFAERQIGLLDNTHHLFKSFKTLKKEQQGEGVSAMIKRFPEISDAGKLSKPEFEKLMLKMDKDLIWYSNLVSQNLKYRDLDRFNSIDRIRTKWGDKSQGYFNYNYASGAVTAIKELKNQAFETRGASLKLKEKENSNNDDATNPVPTTPGGEKIGTMAKSIGSGSQVKNTTINIDSFVKGFNPTHQTINQMSKDELERWMTDMFLRVVRSVEMS